MMTNDLIKINGQSTLAIADNLDKVIKMRIRRFNRFLKETGLEVHSIPIDQYIDWLTDETELSHNSIVTYVNTIRGIYRKLLKDNGGRQSLFDSFGDMDFVEKQARVNEFLIRARNILDSIVIREHKQQDAIGGNHIRMTRSQAESLMDTPDVNTIQGLRDAAIISLMLSTGLREEELCGLEVGDLRTESNDGVLCLYVRNGKGNKSRLIPYGELSWVLVLVDKWLEMSGIKDGPVFVGYWRGYTKMRGKLTGRSIQNILKAYPIVIDGELATLKPHDLRRTYAKLYYDAKQDIVRLSQNLGHSSINTTRSYIGDGDMKKRAPEQIINFNLNKLMG